MVPTTRNRRSQRSKPLSVGPMCEVETAQERGLPATGTRDLETAQSEGDVAATQLDGLAREQEENEGSSMEESGPTSEGSGSLPGIQDIFLKQSARE